MTQKSIVFVAGLGRCGTTMTMTMLDRGGFPVAGLRPAYEVSQMRLMGVDLDWVRAQAGRAVKWIDPLNARISRNHLPTRPVILHIHRDSGEMARSQIKMLGLFGLAPSRGAVRAMKKSIMRDKPILTAYLNNLGTVYHFSFEWILHDPNAAARKLAAIIDAETGLPFDVAAAAMVPLARSPRCAPDMSLELGLV